MALDGTGTIDGSRSLGQHLATRLRQIGCTEFFGVPGDYNLSLLDELEKDPGLRGVWCSSELGAGYAADGYARVKGVGALVVTFTVGGLSAINAVAGAYAEDLPLIVITGGPNSNDLGSGRLVHHTIGKGDHYFQERDAMAAVTADQVVIHSLEDAHELIDRAISTALLRSKPTYICVCCNLAGQAHPSFSRTPIPYSLSPRVSNPKSLEAAVEAAAEFFGSKKSVVLVAGRKIRMSKAEKQFMALADAMGAGVAIMPAAKGLVPESHPSFMGQYWGEMSSPHVGEAVEGADAYLFAGAVFNDYATAGGSLKLKEAKMLCVDYDRVKIAGGLGGQVFGCVLMPDFLAALAKKVQHKPAALEAFRRQQEGSPALGFPAPPEKPSTKPLQAKELFGNVQQLLSSSTVLIAETGDAVFECASIRLPNGCPLEWSQQYGSIGWSVGATLGASVGAAPAGKRVVACIGDGSFQMTAVEVSTMLRYSANPIILLGNNAGYTIEVEIHDGPYNRIQNWDYCGLAKAFAAGGGELFTARVKTEAELAAALKHAQTEATTACCLIECILDKDDCAPELVEWGRRVSKANSRPPEKHS